MVVLCQCHSALIVSGNGRTDVMWTVNTKPSSWLKLSKLVPERVLDEFDGPQLFTTRSDDGQLLLAYVCGEGPDFERFLLVPTTERIVHKIEANELALRDALTGQALVWLVDRKFDGSVTAPGEVDPAELPESALPRHGAYLYPTPEPLLSIRLMGDGLVPERVPASVVRRAVDGATGAMKALIRHVLDVRPDPGRPTESFRRYYDLPATEFAFRSFEVSFGVPETLVQTNLVDDRSVLDEVSKLLDNGLAWASGNDQPRQSANSEWRAIVEALSHLTPPQKGVIEAVQIGGELARRPHRAVTLTRVASERVNFARKQLAAENPSEVSLEGYVREFDKDRLSFWLRKGDGTDIEQITFSEEQYDDAWLAFETERPVTVIAYRASGSTRTAELVSVAFKVA